MSELRKEDLKRQEAAIRKQLEKATIPDLRVELSAHGLADIGNKEQLVERIVEHRLAEWRKQEALATSQDGLQHVASGALPPDEDVRSKMSHDTFPKEFTDTLLQFVSSAQDRQSRDLQRQFELLLDKQQEQQRQHEKTQMQFMASLVESVKRGSTSGASESSSSNDPLIIHRKFARLLSEVTQELDALGDSLSTGEDVNEVEGHLESLERIYDHFDGFFNNKVDLLDGDERKDSMIEERKLLHGKVSQARMEARRVIRHKRQEAEEDRRAGALAAGMDPPDFFGSPLAFPEWWEAFEAQVHTNIRVSKFYKMLYLKRALKGDAASVLSNLAPVADNYDKAVTLVKDRFGKNRVVVRHLVHRLINLEAPTGQDHHSLRKLRDDLFSGLSTLKGHAPTVDTLLVPILESKLPQTIREMWERKISASVKDDEFASEDQFFSFLTAEVEAREAAAEACSKKHEKHPEGKAKGGSPVKKSIGGISSTAQALVADALPETKPNKAKQVYEAPKECPVCHKPPHNLASCQVFGQKTREQRCVLIMTDLSRVICKNCLELKGTKTHGGKNCDVRCGQDNCQGFHHELWYHRTKEGTTQQKDTTLVSASLPGTGLSAFKMARSQKILPTTLAYVVHGGRRELVRVGIDSFSSKTFITNRVVEKLGVPVSAPKEVLVSGFNGHVTAERMSLVQLELRSRCRPDYALDVLASVKMGSICAPLGAVKFDSAKIQHLQGLLTTEDVDMEEVELDVLIGIDYFGQLVEGIVPAPGPGMPYAFITPLGQIISGTMAAESEDELDHAMLLQEGISPGMTLEEKRGLHAQVEKFWSLESLGLIDQGEALTHAERAAEAHFCANTTFDGERYVVALPFEEGAPPLQNNYHIARRLLEQSERRLLKDNSRMEVYKKAINEYEELGFAKELTPEEYDEIKDGPCYFVPHHPVFKESSQSTKVRIVFNASSQDFTGLSLNSCLLAGPPLQPDIGQVLIRFRCHRIGMNGDIKKMFCQTRITPDHYRFQLYLWRDCEVSQPPRVMAMTRVMFGVTSSPFLAMRSVKEHVRNPEMAALYPRGAQEVERNTYVDDVLSGGETEEEVIHLQRELVQILAKGGWELTKFASNSAEVLKAIPEGQRLPGQMVELMEDEIGTDATTALGLRWFTGEDVLMCNMPDTLKTRLQKITKRHILAKVSSIYDIFGFFSPYTIRGKILIQELWREGLAWDDVCTNEARRRFEDWEAELPMLESVKIPRRIGISSPSQVQLHGFADASEAAYGALVYLRFTDSSQQGHVYLVMAKTRVAPLKTKSLPRLELMAAHSLAHLYSYVVRALRLELNSVHLWSDSSIALAWICQVSTRWKTFVRNRVQEIQDLTGISCWRHCPGEENPADLLSRGAKLSELASRSDYWHGPWWLSKEEEYWPAAHQTTVASTEEEEAPTVSLPISEVESLPEFFHKYERFSKLVRIVAWILRWTARSRSDGSSGLRDLSTEELRKARYQVFLVLQMKSFPKEMDDLREGLTVSVTSRLSGLNPLLCKETGLLLMQGRVQCSQLEVPSRRPIILPNSNQVVRKLILDVHIRGKHASQTTTLALVREEYWILHSRSEVRRALQACLICRHYAAKLGTQIMGDLPEERIAVAPAFTHIGVDFTGPVYLKQSDKQVSKAYILVFTCLTSRMVHFELTWDMSAEEFLFAFRRMIARRGLCHTIFSDNAKSFKKADKILHASLCKGEMGSVVESPEVQRFFTNQGIEWRYIAERSPFRGGVWERMNRSLKEPLRKVLGRAMLRHSEFSALLADVEATLNQRPLTYMMEGDQEIVLTPAHLALGRSLYTLPEVQRDVPISKRYRYLQKLLRHLWKRWSKEYIPDLQPRSKWKISEAPLNKGDIVYVTEENVKRSMWPMGKITKAIGSHDGQVRTYQVRTSKGEIVRPIQRLILIEKGDASSSVDSKALEASQGEIEQDLLDDPTSGSCQGGECVDKVELDSGHPETLNVLSQNKVKQLTRTGREVRKPARFCD